MLDSLQNLLIEYQADLGSLSRFHPLDCSLARVERFERLVQEWLDRLQRIDRSLLGYDGRVDAVLFDNHLRYEACRLEIQREEQAELRKLLPFAQAIAELEEARMRMEPIDPQRAADAINLAEKLAHQAREGGQFGGRTYRCKQWTDELIKALTGWFEYYEGYNAEASWWLSKPVEGLKGALQSLSDELKAKDESELNGQAVGREALETDLRFEMVPFSPEELIAIGEREYAWCLEEMKRASAKLGFGEDWHAALEATKETCVPPGRQTAVVRELALEAIDYLRRNDLVTVPDLAAETWRMQMMSPEAQKVSPFFLGGEAIIVSYPTHTMTHEEKVMSMRGNNPHFSRATVQHELIPGHHLQFFMLARHRPYREVFGTPFWIEGWTIYWEMLLWNLGFPRNAWDRIGMLFWRMHRCVRVVFSLRFHLGEISAQDCVEMLVERVGHERANAEAEVRRSFNGAWPPLYQAAYLIGGLMFMQMRRDVVDSGRMDQKNFHDEILRQNQMPPRMLRQVLLGEEPTPFDPRKKLRI